MKKIFFYLLFFFLFASRTFAAGTAELSVHWANTSPTTVGSAEPNQICLEWSCTPDSNGTLDISVNDVVRKIDDPILIDWVNAKMWTFCNYVSQVEVMVDGCYGWRVQLRDDAGNDILDKLIGKSTTQTGGRIIQLPLGIQVMNLPVPYATGMKQKNSAGVYESKTFKLRIILFR